MFIDVLKMQLYIFSIIAIYTIVIQISIVFFLFFFLLIYKVNNFLCNPGYDVTRWKDILVKLNQTKTYFTTNAASPFCSE